MAETKACVPATEFIRWKVVLQEEPNQFNALYWFLAQVAFEIWKLPYRVWGKEPPDSITIKNFVLKFEDVRSNAPPEKVLLPKDDLPDVMKKAEEYAREETDEEKKARISARSKSYWFGITKVDKAGTVVANGQTATTPPRN